MKINLTAEAKDFLQERAKSIYVTLVRKGG